MKIKRTGQSSSPSQVQGRRAGGVETEKTARVERKEVTDTVTLSEDALATAAAEPVNSVEATGQADAHGPLPDPRETSRAVLEKELASVFREIYL